MIQTTARNADLATIAGLLQDQQVVKHDAVVPAQAIVATRGRLMIAGMGPDGPAGLPGFFDPTSVMDEGFADKLGVPLAYLRRMRAEGRTDLYDANLNGWLHGDVNGMYPQGDAFGKADDRRFLVRSFVDPHTGEGVGRALLSDKFKMIDNLDVLMAALEGAKASGADVQVEACNLTERRMSIDLVAPGVAIAAEALLKGYRNPFADGAERAGFDRWQGVARAEGKAYDGEGETMPVVWGGFRIDNSETGGGQFRITPRVSVRVCKNGLVISGDAFSQVHLGGRMDEGVVRWSDETQQKSVELVRSVARDAVSSFLDEGYVKGIVDRLTEADKPVTDAAKTVELVASRLRFTKEQQAGILDHFIHGGQVTAFGVVNAVTSYAQVVESPDEAYELEAAAMQAFEVALSAS